MFGSPVNRVKITGYAAANAIPRSPDLSLRQRTSEYFHQMVFYTVMYAVDAAFWASHVRRWLWGRSAGAVKGFEDELEAQMAEMMKREYGVEIDPAMFNA